MELVPSTRLQNNEIIQSLKVVMMPKLNFLQAKRPPDTTLTSWYDLTLALVGILPKYRCHLTIDMTQVYIYNDIPLVSSVAVGCFPSHDHPVVPGTSEAQLEVSV